MVLSACNPDVTLTWFDEVVTRNYFDSMQAVNIKELKAKLSSYIRQVRAGEVFLVTDRNHVVAQLGPVDASPGSISPDLAARVTTIGARPPLRGRRPTDYHRTTEPSGIDAAEADALLDWSRADGTERSAT